MGAPLGNQNARKRHWSTAIEAAVMQEDVRTKKKHLHIIAERLIAKAKRGDIQAIKEIGDRLDGKAVQAIEGRVEADLTVQVLRFSEVADADNQAT